MESLAKCHPRRSWPTEPKNLHYSKASHENIINFVLLTPFQYHYHHHHHHQSFLPKSRSFTADSGTKTEVLSKGRSSPANSGTKVAVIEMNRCDNFPLLFTLFSVRTEIYIKTLLLLFCIHFVQ